jgi:hypothetical protein
MSVAIDEKVDRVHSEHSDRQDNRSLGLRTSTYDEVASGLISALMFVGVCVAILLVLFFSMKIFARQEPVAVTVVEDPGGSETGGSARDLEEPSAEEVPELFETTPMQSVETLTAAVSSKAVMMDDMSLETEFTTSSTTGKGKGRQAGSGPGTGQETVPRAQRWAIHFDGGNLKTYAQQLDHFGIELAAIGGEDNLVHYAFHLSKAKPDYRPGPPDSEQRLYMTWRRGPLQQADRQLLTKAGVNLQGRVTMQFYPPETEKQLATLEREYAGSKDINDIRRTTFEVRPDGDKFKFVVTGQQSF